MEINCFVRKVSYPKDSLFHYPSLANISIKHEMARISYETMTYTELKE